MIARSFFFDEFLYSEMFGYVWAVVYFKFNVSMIKSLFTILLVCFLSTISLAQWGVHMAQIRPVGELGMVLEKQVGFGISYSNEFDGGWRTGFEVSFFNMHQRIADFPIVGTITGGNGTFVSLGTQNFKKYNLLFFDGFCDRAIIDKDKFQLYGGGGICIGAAAVDYETNSPRISTTSYYGGGTIGGLFLRLGYDYHLDDNFTVGLIGTRRVYFQQDAGIFGNYIYRFSLSYLLD